MFSRFRVDVAVVVTAALVTGLVACTGKAPAGRPPGVPRYATSLPQAEGDVRRQEGTHWHVQARP